MGRQWGATCPRLDLVGAAETAFTSPASERSVLPEEFPAAR